jgi:hypothetical protein
MRKATLTLSELINRLLRLERDGLGNCEVYKASEMGIWRLIDVRVYEHRNYTGELSFKKHIELLDDTEGGENDTK